MSGRAVPSEDGPQAARRTRAVIDPKGGMEFAAGERLFTVEVNGNVTFRPFPKSRAGRRTIPLPSFVMQHLGLHRGRYEQGPVGEVFTNTAGGPLRRSLFRKRVWRPALVRAGLLGTIRQDEDSTWRATWVGADGIEASQEFSEHGQAVAHVAEHAGRGLRFHDLRHSYATWLISTGVPVNDVQKVMGHEKGSTTLNLYTHADDDRDARVLKAFADFFAD